MKKYELQKMSSAYVLDKNDDRLYSIEAFWDVAYIKPMSSKCRKYRKTTRISLDDAIEILNCAKSTDISWNE